MAKPLAKLLSMPKRRWAQFSLATLFAIVTISAIAIWSFRYVWPASQRWYASRSLIQAVERGDVDAFEEAVGAIERIQPPIPEDPKLGRFIAPRLAMAEPAAERLVVSLSAPSVESRLLAAIVLGLIRPRSRSVVPQLTDAIDDPDDRVRQAACYALSQFKSGGEANPAIPAIRKLYDSSGSTGPRHTASFEALLDLHAFHGAVSYARACPGPSARNHAEYFLDKILPSRSELRSQLEMRDWCRTELAKSRAHLATAEDEAERESRLDEVRILERELHDFDDQIQRLESAEE